MTELCQTCLGCQQMERDDFHGVHRCPQYVDGREPEGQIAMEDRYMDMFKIDSLGMEG